MFSHVFAQAGGNPFPYQVVMYPALAFGAFVATLYLFRSIFNIPSFLRYQKAQIRLLEEIAKIQGVDGTKVQSIISETHGWDSVPAQNTTAPKSTAAQKA